MRLSIVNYGLDTGADVPQYAKREDAELIKIAEDIIHKYNFGAGAAVVSEVFHTGLKNSNHRKYMEKGMDHAIVSFYSPHVTPFLMHHETGGGGAFNSGNPTVLSVGSNIFAKYVRRHIETATGPATGYGKVVTFVPSNAMIGGQRAIDALRSRRLLTVSLGARVADKDYQCSLCGLSLYDEECTHTPGKEYDGAVCMAEVYNPMFREYSAVYNPSDIHAAVRRMDVMEGYGTDDKHHVIDQEPATGYIQIYESIGKKIYPSAYPHQESNGAVDDVTKFTGTSLQDMHADSALCELIATYEKQMSNKDKTISTLATALKNKIDELEELKMQRGIVDTLTRESSPQSLPGNNSNHIVPEKTDPLEPGEVAFSSLTDQEEPPPLSVDDPNPAMRGNRPFIESTPGESNGRAAEREDINVTPPPAVENNSPPAQPPHVDIREILSKRRLERIPPHKKSENYRGIRSLALAIRHY